MAPHDKLTRWLDLIAALLRRRQPASFEQLCSDVPAYAASGARRDSVLRTFERDKDELRRLGIAIETLTDAHAGESLYRLRAEAFYLPYLSLCDSEFPRTVDARSIERPKGFGYQGLSIYPVTPDERVTLRRAASRVRALGNPTLDRDAESALRKLEFDLGLLPVAEPLVTANPVDAAVFELLGAALDDRKRVTFTYRSIGREVIGSRTVEPYGLVFMTGHWYLVARDVTAEDIRQFRISRISDATPNGSKRQQPDYEIPVTFDLPAHAASRQAWELGDNDAVAVTVQFRGASGQVQQAARFGAPVNGRVEDATAHATDSAAAMVQRIFAVRRREPFLRWLLTFAGDARPLAPDTFVNEWQALVQHSISAYAITHAMPSTATESA